MSNQLPEDGRVIHNAPVVGSELTKDQTLDTNTDKYPNLRAQVEAEYQLAHTFMKPKVEKWLLMYKLYNNQKRDPDAVGDPLLFTTMQTIVASLYDDRLQVEFQPNDEGDDEVAENLTDLAEYDYYKMGKDVLDYYWDFDACFTGRGLIDFSTFNRQEKTPYPSIIDPATFLRDPFAISVNGDMQGKGGLRFWGLELRVTKDELEQHPDTFNIERLDFDDEDDELSVNAMQARDEAQGRASVVDGQLQVADEKKGTRVLGDNAEYKILQWCTHYNGKKIITWWGNNRQVCVRYSVIGEPEKRWGLVDRTIYPMSHDWDGVSIPDLIEDKQRARAQVQNLAIKSMMYDLHPMYMFDKNRIKNTNDLQFAFNKYIPVQGETRGAIEPINKFSPNMNMADNILSFLDAGAQRSTATPELQQGIVSKEQRTLGELNIVASKVDTRYSLSAKIFGWSERHFWQQWYMLYKENFKSNIDEKVIRISGALGAKFRELTKDNIIGQVDPDVSIESAILAEAEKMKMLQRANSFAGVVMADPGANRRFIINKLGRLHGFTTEEIKLMFPPDIEEMVAEDENNVINDDKLPEIDPMDNHAVHIQIHNKSKDTDAKYAHIEAHKSALLAQRNNPKLRPGDPSQQQGMDAQDGGAPQQPGQQQNAGQMLQRAGQQQAQGVPMASEGGGGIG